MYTCEDSCQSLLRIQKGDLISSYILPIGLTQKEVFSGFSMRKRGILEKASHQQDEQAEERGSHLVFYKSEKIVKRNVIKEAKKISIYLDNRSLGTNKVRILKEIKSGKICIIDSLANLSPETFKEDRSQYQDLKAGNHPDWYEYEL